MEVDVGEHQPSPPSGYDWVQAGTSRILPHRAGSPAAAAGAAAARPRGAVETATAASLRLGTASGRAVMNRTLTWRASAAGFPSAITRVSVASVASSSPWSLTEWRATVDPSAAHTPALYHLVRRPPGSRARSETSIHEPGGVSASQEGMARVTPNPAGVTGLVTSPKT